MSLHEAVLDRRLAAREMQQDGLNISQIAGELHVNPETVRHYLGEPLAPERIDEARACVEAAKLAYANQENRTSGVLAVIDSAAQALRSAAMLMAEEVRD